MSVFPPGMKRYGVPNATGKRETSDASAGTTTGAPSGVGADPEAVGVDRRRSDRVNHARAVRVELRLGLRCVRADALWRVARLSRQVVADARPGDAAVDRLPQVVVAEEQHA